MNNSKINNFIFYIIFLLLSSFSFCLLVNSYATGSGGFMYPVDTDPFGIPHKKWLADWWKANLAISAENHPNYINLSTSIDNTKNPSKCFIGEDKVHNVLFLGLPNTEDKFPVRTCDVPAGKAIFLPIESSQCDYGIEEIKTKNDLISCAKSGNDGVHASVTLDGVKGDYQVEKHRFMTDPFNITMNNKLMGDYHGTFGSLSEGFMLELKPLTVGDHKLNLIVSVANPANPVYDYFQNANFNFRVK
jgi:hypothetical protein